MSGEFEIDDICFFIFFKEIQRRDKEKNVGPVKSEFFRLCAVA